ncbi:cAMP-binding domain of CRP or a regulatory subunit of cAMP-dependent protein kinases [Cnuella takakiae]|uniref:cAMP-binding domain of CRP or a regulatory subunit of cAMP-dependent protein kinases n=1 Tax=Cnuella takakiae TaxID=1302690 RepID=A0A1M5CRK8_9BACT|nr:Crp/Fnr family transcriptional regulator [Cnuella takakiae]OLY91916.1 cyclic nucleotide-binding protein [Cnuella takakiae]SHF57296.1 cAMP-binding domain of CRP or a regulatory subunit of cAMP-dependent protein kinases [Cnuella takakiae]
MFELLQKKIGAQVRLSEAEVDLCNSMFGQRSIRKRQYLLQEGEVCRYQYFVSRGILRSYTTDDKGAEHILQFASEGWWMADLYSFFTGEASLYNMEAIEDAEVLMISRDNWDRLLQELPKLEHYFRVLLQNHLVATQRRLLVSLSEPAEQRYLRFMDAYPDCLQRVPQHMIAAYLGITKESLSRLRSRMSRKD